MDDALVIRDKEVDAGTLPVDLARRPSLLMVEDNPLVAYVLANVIEECGCTAIKASSWGAFVKGLEAHQPDGITLDLSVPGCDGTEILRELAQRGFSGLVMIISGLDAQQIDEAGELGASLGLRMALPLAKPFRYEELADRLKLLNPLPAE